MVTALTGQRTNSKNGPGPGRHFVPGDPKECREHASRCAELAHTAKSPDLKMTLINLSKNWLKLAIELERTNALLEIADSSPRPAGPYTQKADMKR